MYAGKSDVNAPRESFRIHLSHTGYDLCLPENNPYNALNSVMGTAPLAGSHSPRTNRPEINVEGKNMFNLHNMIRQSSLSQIRECRLTAHNGQQRYRG
jgi:hypothetical protein